MSSDITTQYEIRRTHRGRYSVDSRRVPLGVVIHDTAGYEPGDLATLTGPGASVHYYVTRRADIYDMVDERHIAWHTAACGAIPSLTRWWPEWLPALPPGAPDVSAANFWTIGIELEHGPSAADTDWPQVQLQAARALVADILRRYHLPPERVVCHRDLQTDRTDPRGLSVADLLGMEGDRMATVSDAQRALLLALDELGISPEQAEQQVRTLAALGADHTSVIGWIEEIGALREQVAALQSTQADRDVQAAEIILRGGQRIVLFPAAGGAGGTGMHGAS